MRRLILTLAFTTAAFLPTISHAQGITDARTFVRMCSGQDVDSLEVRLCLVYLQAFSGGHATTVAMTQPRTFGFCTPVQTTLGQIRAIVVAYAKTTVGRVILEMPTPSTDMLIYTAMAATFPCRQIGQR